MDLDSQNTMKDLHEFERTEYAGADFSVANAAVIFVHGRGDASDKMLGLARQVVDDPSIALVFPKATNGTWYPKSFLAPLAENQPWLDSALATLARVVVHLKSRGIMENRVFLLGFSQGGCLALEYATRHATTYGGVMVLSGGLIGPEIDVTRYHGDFGGTKVFIGCSDIDFHIPLRRLHESEKVLMERGADVNLRIYPGMGHLINEDEIQQVKSIIGFHKMKSI